MISLVSPVRTRAHRWPAGGKLLAVCIPGHARELDAITQEETLVAIRRQVNRDPDLCSKAADIRHHIQTLCSYRSNTMTTWQHLLPLGKLN